MQAVSLSLRNSLLASGALVVVLVLFLLLKPGETTVRRTEAGFEPAHVTVHVGESIRFVNETEEPIWPASDSHPSHTLYPAFDPQEPIQPGASWRFTFDKIGVWEYHDHMQSTLTGVVTVEGAIDESIRACTERNKDERGIFPECWQGDVIAALQKDGLSGAFERIDFFFANDPLFKENCHDVMHAVGKAAYALYETSHEVMDDSRTAYCGYGFYHGFIEEMQVHEGVGQYQEVRSYCERLASLRPQTLGTCYHGIGHAAFDALEGDLWGDPEAMTDASLAVCEEAALTLQTRSWCSSGVYNSYANAMSATNYFLSYEGFDPRTFCPLQEKAYQQSCYSELGIGYIRSHTLSIEEALTFSRSVDPEFVPRMLYVYFADYVKQNMSTYDPVTFSSLCLALETTSEKGSCLTGILQGIREQSKPQEAYKNHFALCEQVPEGELRTTCVEDVVAHAGELADDSDFLLACRAISGVPASLCAGTN